MHIHSLTSHHQLACVFRSLLASTVDRQTERVVAMASREVSIQMAGVLDGEPGCTPSPDPLLVRASSRAARVSSIEAADGASGAGWTTKYAAVAAHAETPCSVSFSVPVSPFVHASDAEMGAATVLPSESKLEQVHHPSVPQLLKQTRHHSQPSLVVRGPAPLAAVSVPRSNSTRERDRRFDHFKTFSGRLERQLSSLRGVPQDPPATDVEHAASKISEEGTDEDDDVPTADRYFAALEGPELETLRVRTT
jgi:hypothetical protein